MEISEDMPEDPEAAFQGLVVLAFLDAGPEAAVEMGAGMTGDGGYKGVA